MIVYSARRVATIAVDRRVRAAVRGRMRFVTILGLAAVLATVGPAASQVERPFPAGFRWGAAIAGFQSDMGLGAPNDEGTDWWV